MVPEQGCSVQVFDKDGNDASTAYSGQVMTVICVGSEEYELDYLTVTNADDIMPTMCSEGQAFTFTMPDCDVEVSAVYKEKIADYAYKISFNKNAKDAKGTMKSVSGNLAEGGSLPANTFTYAKKVFTGWNTKADGSGISYTDCESLTLTIGARIPKCTFTAPVGLVFAGWKINNEGDIIQNEALASALGDPNGNIL